MLMVFWPSVLPVQVIVVPPVVVDAVRSTLVVLQVNTAGVAMLRLGVVMS